MVLRSLGCVTALRLTINWFRPSGTQAGAFQRFPVSPLRRHAVVRHQPLIVGHRVYIVPVDLHQLGP